MQNYPLLKRVGKAGKPVMLKRALSATIEEWLGAAEYILAGGNKDVILCERGIRAFGKITRFTLDLTAVPLLKEVTHLPVVVDPSHGTGHRQLVAPMARAAIAAGADGLIVEVHNEPEKALSDGAQSLRPEGFATLMRGVRPVAEAVGRII
jgi:3-deoxy-7-phosphoheptulonate synthase